MGRYKEEQMRRHDSNYGRTEYKDRQGTQSDHRTVPTALEITEALGGTWDARRSEGIACCPAHEDRTPSLVIFDRDEQGGDGRANFHCRAKCEWTKIIAALRKRGLWPEWFGSQVEYVCEYTYKLSDGTSYLRVVRLREINADGSPKLKKDGKQSKKFWMYHWDTASDSWKLGKPSGPKVPYLLPELAAAQADKPVFVVEGEKCADELSKLGFVATTNAEGAGQWTDDLNRYFSQREVFVLADNDKAGKDHAHHVARKLHGVASIVRLPQLEGVPPKGDVVDWLLAGNDPATLVDICRASSPYNPASNDSDASSERQALSEEEQLLAELNQRYCVVRVSGKTRVLVFEKENGREVASFLSFEDFRNFHLNRRAGRVPLGKWWLENSRRRQYEGLVFHPGGEPEIDNKLNLWRGWGVIPKSGKWSKMQAHIEEVLAAGDAKSARYIFNWLAWAVQNPAKQAEVAMVFRGKRGTGKGLLARNMLELFGQHGVQISSVDHLAGRFNGHFHDCCLLFADEALWPGDKPAEGTLKRIVTEDTLFIERKGIDGVLISNRLKIIMASNEDWVVPAGNMERRFEVFDVSDHVAQNQKWFAPIYKEMADGGREAMLFDLLHADLGKWHPRQIIQTKALRDQQIRSLKASDQWRLTLLENGWLPGGDKEAKCEARSNGHNDDDGLFQHARKNVAGLRNVSDHVLGQYLVSWKCAPRRWKDYRGWRFPPLLEMRAEWEREYPGWDWELPDLTEWGEQKF